MATLIFILSLVAASFAAYGSMLFVDRKNHKAEYEFGSMIFLIGNATTIALGLHIGDLVLVSAQLGLVWFTIPMYQEHKNAKIFSIGCLLYFLVLILILKVNTNFHFTASYIGAIASVIAIYGAWLMSKYRFTEMAWCWLIADLIFIYVAVLNKLPILGVLAMIFVYHSSLRLLGYKRNGLFTFSK